MQRLFQRISSVSTGTYSHTDCLQYAQRSIWPINFLCRLFGMNAIKLRRSEEILKTRRSDWWYFGTYVSTFLVLTAYTMLRLLDDQRNFVIIDKSIVITEVLVMITLMFIVIVVTFLTRKLYVRAMNLLAKVDVVLFRHGFNFDYGKLLGWNYVILAFMITSLLVRTILLSMTIRVDLLQNLTSLSSGVVKALSKYQYVALVLQLQLRFRTLNSALLDFRSAAAGRHLANAYCAKAEEHLRRSLYTVCRLHYRLADVAELLSTAFGFQLLVSIAVSLSDILFQAYYLYYVLTGKAHSSTTSVMVACPIAWLLDEVVEVYWLVYACATTTEYANETPTILHELRNKSYDKELENEIQTYSLQMLHQAVRFSVLGFFTIDYTLIYSIVGAVTTYLVIFIQFDQSSGGGNVNATQISG